MTEPPKNKSKTSTSSYLPEFLEYARKRKSLSASAVSKAIGYSSSYVAKIESGHMEPAVKAFARMAVVLELSDPEIAALVKMAALEVPDAL